MNKLEFDRDAAVQMYLDGKSPNAVGKVVDCLYKDSVINLDRKMKLAQEIING